MELRRIIVTMFIIIAPTHTEQASDFTVRVAGTQKFKVCNVLLAYDDPDRFLDIGESLVTQLADLGKGLVVIDLNKKWRLSRYDNIHRHGIHCYLQIFQFFNPQNSISSSNFSELISWQYGTYTWKDTDHYVFHTQTTNVDSLLMAPEVQKLKFKVALGISSNPEESFTMKTSCFYCYEGRPGIVPILLPESDEELPFLNALFPDFVLNFNYFRLRAAVSSKIMYRIEIYKREDDHWEGKPGPHTQLIQLCQRRMNFTFELFPSAGGGGSGVKWPNGTWSGSMADVLYKNADFGMVTAQILQRDELVSFSFPITYDWLTFATGRPKEIHTWKKIFWPFSVHFWLSLVPCLLLVLLILYVLPEAVKKVQRQTKVATESWSLIWKNVWYLWATLLEQDQSGIANSPVLQSFVIFWLLFALVVTTAYRSQLVPSLAFPYVEQPPETFEELTASSYKWGLYYLAGAAYAAFRSSTNPTYVQIFQGMELEHSAVNCLVRAIETRFGCIIYEASAVDVMHRTLSVRGGAPPILVAPTTTFFISSCWVMEKRAVFRPNFETIMHWTMDMGLNNHWVAMNYARLREEKLRGNNSQTTVRVRILDAGPKALDIEEFIGPFYLFITGIILSFLAWLVEALVVGERKVVRFVVKTLKERGKTCTPPKEHRASVIRNEEIRRMWNIFDRNKQFQSELDQTGMLRV